MSALSYEEKLEAFRLEVEARRRKEPQLEIESRCQRCGDINEQVVNGRLVCVDCTCDAKRALSRLPASIAGVQLQPEHLAVSLLPYIGKSIWLEGHEREVAGAIKGLVLGKPNLDIQVISDLGIQNSRNRDYGDEETKSIEHIIDPPGLLVLWLGMVRVEWRQGPGAILEALFMRWGKPVWLATTHEQPLAGLEVYSDELRERLSKLPKVELSGTPATEPKAKTAVPSKKAPSVKTTAAKWPGTCSACTKPYSAGDPMVWKAEIVRANGKAGGFVHPGCVK